MNKEVKIYTKTGDTGKTQLANGKFVDKDDIQIDTTGDLDELISYLGIIRSEENTKQDVNQFLIEIQDRLMYISSKISGWENELEIGWSDVKKLEVWIDRYVDKYDLAPNFVLPGGNKLSACVDVARTICRRAERKMISLNKIDKLDSYIIVYVNRLSDFLFMLSRMYLIENNGNLMYWNK